MSICLVCSGLTSVYYFEFTDLGDWEERGVGEEEESLFDVTRFYQV